MIKIKYLTILITAFAIAVISNEVNSLPASSFIIIPSGIKSDFYSKTGAVYRVVSSDEDFTLSDTVNQKILSGKTVSGKKIILLSAGNFSAPAEKDLKPYLRNTPYLNTDKESIKKAASKFRNSKNPVIDVSRFVFNHISDKKTGIPMIPAVSILSGKSGDCTEHTILTISILRTINIPSRAVMGLILVEDFSGIKNVFVYHMWAEAFHNGKWVMADPTRPDDIHQNRYIALAYHNLMTEMPSEYFRAISTMQEMKITFIE